MATRIKFSFLPAFFVTLSAVFVFAAGWRIHRYATEPASGEVSSTIAGSNDEGTSNAISSRRTTVDSPVAGQAPSPAGSDNASPAQASVTSAREKRFNELLHGGAAATTGPSVPGGSPAPLQNPTVRPPAPAPAPQKPPEKTLMQKILSPIASVFGGGSSSSGSGSSNQGPRGTSGSAGQNQDRDPNSDSTPPQLMAIEFAPAQVHDGETAQLVITATDDISGVRNVSGSIVSPSGKAPQGFSAQRESPDSNRYIARLAIPKDAEEGLWHISFLSMSDFASNTMNWSSGQPGLPSQAVLRVVSNRPDNTPPTVHNVWLDKPSMAAGEKNTVFVQADDDKSGVSVVSGVFHRNNARIGFGCHLSDANTNVWQCELQVPQCLDCGEWQLEQIQMQDKAGNIGYAYARDTPVVAAVKLVINGESCDSSAPTMQSFELDQTQISNAQRNTITVTARVTDDLCGVNSVSGQVSGPPSNDGSQRTLYFTCKPGADPNLWIGRIDVEAKSAKGTWTVVWVNVLDQGNNLRTYSKSDPPVNGAAFVVH